MTMIHKILFYRSKFVFISAIFLLLLKYPPPKKKKQKSISKTQGVSFEWYLPNWHDVGQNEKCVACWKFWQSKYGKRDELEGKFDENNFLVFAEVFHNYHQGFVKWYSQNEIQSNSRVYSSFVSIYINPVTN
jgi:hypothetical protein